MNNNNNKYNNVNVEAILNTEGNKANYLYASCHTSIDKDLMLKFAKQYFNEYFFVEDFAGEPVVLRPFHSTRIIEGNDGRKRTYTTLKYKKYTHEKFIKQRRKEIFEVRVENQRTNKMEVKEIRYVDFWLDTMTDLCKVYKETVFDPSPYFDNPDVLNMWTGFVEPKKGDVKIFLDYIEKLVGNKVNAEYIVKLIAYTVRFPHRNTGTSIVLVGPHGCGKSTLSETIRAICPNHSNTVENLKKDLLEGFNEEYTYTKYFLHEESFFSGDKESSNHLKTLITGETRKTKTKFFANDGVDNYAFHVFTSNHEVPVNLEIGDRRYNLFKCRKTDFNYDEYYDWLKGEGKHSLVNYFMNEVDLEGFNPRKILKTKEHDEATLSCLPPIENYLNQLLHLECEWLEVFDDESLISEKWISEEIKVNRQKVYDGFVKYCKDHDLHKTLRDNPPAVFTKKLAELFDFPKNHKDNWKDAKIGRYYKIPQLNKAREMFCEAIKVDICVFYQEKYEEKIEAQIKKLEYEANLKSGKFDHAKKEFPEEVKVEIPKYMPKFGKQEEYYGEEK